MITYISIICLLWFGFQNVVHGRLNAHNVLVANEECIKISDFGLLYLVQNGQSFFHSTRRGFGWVTKAVWSIDFWALSFDQKFRFAFPEISCGEWNNIFLASCTQIMENFSPGISAPSDFPRGISGIFNGMVHISEIFKQSSDLL